MDPAGVGIDEFPILAEQNERLKVIARILEQLSLGETLDANDPYSGMNIFIKQNLELVDKWILKLVEKREEDDGNKETPKSTKRHTKKAAQDVQPDISKYSATTISARELQLLVQILTEAKLLKDTQGPYKIYKEALDQINQSKVRISANIFVLMNVSELDAASFIPSNYSHQIIHTIVDEIFPKEKAMDTPKYMLQQVLLSAFIDPDDAEHKSFEKLLEHMLIVNKL